ncbi:MAG: hypothetical protein K2H73_05765 [Treponemataceae bacterium]|nr:hypothetical protein [Treponemataceae bacterium]
MKMTKKVLLTAAVMAAASFGFMGCGADDDDPNEMFSSGVNNFNIKYINSDGKGSRGVNVTTAKHEGAFVKLTMNQQTNNGGVLGFMWDITEKTNGGEQPWDFWLIGFNYGSSKYGTTGGLGYYVSKFKNVANKQDVNFGATDAHSYTTYSQFNDYAGIAEFKKVEGANGNVFKPCDPNGKTIKDETKKAWEVYVDVSWERDNDTPTGAFVIRLYDPETVGTASKVETAWANDYLDRIVIPASETGYVGSNTIGQKQLGAYANVYADSSVDGSFKYADTYAQAEVAEPDAE